MLKLPIILTSIIPQGSLAISLDRWPPRVSDPIVNSCMYIAIIMSWLDIDRYTIERGIKGQYLSV